MKRKVDIMDVKQALADHRFRDRLGVEFQEDVAKYLTNPGCRCNHKVYRRILKDAKKQLLAYFPDREEVTDEVEEISNLAKNYFTVINCHKDELQSELRKLPPGRKQIAVARHEDQVTVVVNELEYIY